MMVEGSVMNAWLGLYALRHQLHLHRAGRDGRLPCRPLQHRRRGQAQLGRLGVALAVLFIPAALDALALLGASVGAALFGAA